MNNKKSKLPMLMLVIMFSKLIGMLRDFVLAKYYGTSSVSDAYFIASSVPTLLFYFIGHSLATVYIPMYNKVKYENGEKKALEFSGNIVNISLILGLIIVAVLMIFPEYVIKLFASGFDTETSSLASVFIRICAPSILMMILIYVFSGYLQANNSFLPPAAVSLPRNIVIMMSIIIASKFGNMYLGLGLIVSYMAELLMLIPFIIKKGYKYKPIVDLKDENIKKSIYMIMPILLGVSVGQINKIIDRSIASYASTGGVSALSYASVINNAVQEVFVTGIITVLFANCAQMVAAGDFDGVKTKFIKTADMMIFVLIPASVGIVVLAKPIVEICFSRGNFNSESVSITSGALRCYTLGLVFLALRDTMVKVFYAYKNTHITTITSVIAVLINIILNLILYKIIGINGLAIATSISAIFNCVMLSFMLKKIMKDWENKVLFPVILKSTISALIMGITVYYLNKKVSSGFVGLFICIIVGCAIYATISVVIKNPAVKDFINKAKKERL